MEFDILNELITGSVAHIFTDNQEKHQNMLRNSTQMGQDKREIPRQGSLGAVLQTPEKVAHVDFGNSRPSPTAEKLSNLLNNGNGGQNNFQGDYRNQQDFNQQEALPKQIGAGIGGFNSGQGSREGSVGGRSTGNTSHMSVGSMNVSQGGYGSDGVVQKRNAGQDAGKSGMAANEGDQQHKRHNSSSGGVEDLKVWLKYDSNKKYEESLQKLSLDNSKIQGKHLVAYSLPELESEKKRVKNELKVYDQEFITKFKRAPTRSEKEPMRNLYMYYKRLKQYIEKREKIEAQQAKLNPNRDQAKTNVQPQVANQYSNPAEPSQEQAHQNQPTTQQAARPGGTSPSSAGSGGGGGGLGSGDEAKLTVSITISEREAIIKQNGFKNVLDVSRKLNEIKNERKGLRTQLDQFQKNFEETHKRKIRYTKDIVPVQNEFKRYKDLKMDIAKLEQVQKYMPK